MVYPRIKITVSNRNIRVAFHHIGPEDEFRAFLSAFRCHVPVERYDASIKKSYGSFRRNSGSCKLLLQSRRTVCDLLAVYRGANRWSRASTLPAPWRLMFQNPLVLDPTM